jgi:transcriptional regulator with XRE-family HTH domain
MYHLNRKLIERLPKMLKVSRRYLCQSLGVEYRQYNRWTAGDYMSADMLIALSNLTRISLSEFIVLSDTPLQRPSAESYIIPSDSWVPVSWKREELGKLFGVEGKLGIPKYRAAEELGIANYQDLDRYTTPGVKVDVHILLRILNTYRLDASVLFDDANGSIPSFIPTGREKNIAELVEDRFERLKSAEAGRRESERRLANVRLENERLKKENSMLKRSHPYQAEPSGPCRTPADRSGWTFNRKLWQSVPDLFEMTKREFCRRFGFNQDSDFQLVDNVSLSMLVNVCNELHISISHFFIRKGEEPVVHDRGFYEISPRIFVPVECHMENVKYLFGRYSVIGESRESLADRVGIKQRGFEGLANGTNVYSRVMTVADICTQFNLSPGVFLYDNNRSRAEHFPSSNERLILNAIELMKENDELKERNRRLKEKLKNAGKDGPEEY